MVWKVSTAPLNWKSHKSMIIILMEPAWFIVAPTFDVTLNNAGWVELIISHKFWWFILYFLKKKSTMDADLKSGRWQCDVSTSQKSLDLIWNLTNKPECRMLYEEIVLTPSCTSRRCRKVTRILVVRILYILMFHPWDFAGDFYEWCPLDATCTL